MINPINITTIEKYAICTKYKVRPLETKELFRLVYLFLKINLSKANPFALNRYELK